MGMIETSTAPLRLPRRWWLAPLMMLVAIAVAAGDVVIAISKGGEMIHEVFQDRVTYGTPPHRFAAGTPAIVQAIGLGAAIDYVNSIGKPRIRAHEGALVKYAQERLGAINSLRIIGNAPDKGPIVSFEIEGAHPHDVATIIDRSGVALRHAVGVENMMWSSDYPHHGNDWPYSRKVINDTMADVPAEERERRVKDFVKRFKWKGPVFQISALTREGCEPLIRAIYKHVATLRNVVPDDPDPRFDAAPVSSAP